jgi:hypothetical protein
MADKFDLSKRAIEDAAPPKITQQTSIKPGPEIRFSPEPQPPKPSFLDRTFERSKRCVTALNAITRTFIGYGDPSLEAACSRGEIWKATFRSYVFSATPFVMGTLSTLAANSLTGGGFSLLRTAACFGLAAYVAAADATILQTLVFRHGIRDMRDGGIFIKLPSDADPAPRRIVCFRIIWSVIFGLVVAAAIGLALNASAIDRRLAQDDLTVNTPILRQAVTDYNSQLDHLRAAANTERSEIQRLTHLPRRNNANALDRQIATVQQKLDRDNTAIDQFVASRPEKLHNALVHTPGYIPESHDAVVSRFKGLVEVIHDDASSAVPVLAIDALILGLDVFNLCLGGIGSLGRYPARFARRRLEEITEEARAAAANLKCADAPDRGDNDPDDRPPRGGASAAAKPSAVPSEEPASPAAPTMGPHETPPHPASSPPTAMNGVTLAKRGRGRPKGSGKSANLTETSNA